MDCRECGRALPPDSRFCFGCGTAVAARCDGCGTELEPEARFCRRCGQAVAGSEAGEPPAEPRHAGTLAVRQPGRERKVATLLFADIVGFTDISETHDPELVSPLILSVFERLSGVVRRYEGTVEKFAGDAMLAVFGVPTTHEDDPERAVQAGLAMHIAAASLPVDPGVPELRLRIGIETGEVLADRTRATTERDLFVTGDAVNTAARLQSVADPGTVVVGPSTYAATSDAIDYAELPSVKLKGMRAPVAPWRAVAVKADGGDRRRRHGIHAPLVGRDGELALLKEAVRLAVDERQPRLVTVVGSAGVGKSRLSRELEKDLEDLPGVFQWRKGRCLPYASPSFGAIADVIKADAGIHDDDAPATTRDKLDARLATIELGSQAHDVIDALEAVLGIGETRDRPRELLFESWRRYLAAVASTYPLVMVVEDIHWADDGVLAFLDFLARWAEGPMVIICLARHELLERRPDWGRGVLNAATVVLEPLDEVDSAALMAELLYGGVPAALRRRIVIRAEGNPLFAEEMVRMLVDQGTLRFVRGSWDLARSVDELHIPSSVQAVLAARLDALPEHEKRVAQVASVIGRVFWDQLVAHIAGSDVASIHEPIRALQAKDLLVTREPSALAGAAEFGFRHALIRDVAYESLPKRERAVLHREIARWAERELADRIEEFGELIASHLGSSMAYEDELGQGEPASRRELREQTYRAALRAARRAAAMTQLGEAERWYRTAFDIAIALERDARELADVAVSYAEATFLVADPASLVELASVALAAMLALDEVTTADELVIGRLRGVVGEARFRLDDVDGSRTLLRGAIAALDGHPPNATRARLLQQLGWTYWRAGPTPDAVPLLQAALAEADATGDDRTRRWANHDLGISLGMLGDTDAAVSALEESFRLARDADDANLLMSCYVDLPATRGVRGDDVDELIEITIEGLDRVRRAAAGRAITWLAGNLVLFCHEAGRFLDALAYAGEAVEASRAHEPANLPTMLIYRAFSHRLLGDVDAALEDEAAAAALDVDPDLQFADDHALIVAYSRWWEQPHTALAGLMSTMNDEHVPRGSRNHISHHVARMALRLDERDALGKAVKVSEATRWPASPALKARFDWTSALVRDDAGDDVEAAAEILEAHGYRMRAVTAWSDAAILAERTGQDSRAGGRALELAREIGMHPLMGPLPEHRWTRRQPGRSEGSAT